MTRAVVMVMLLAVLLIPLCVFANWDRPGNRLVIEVFRSFEVVDAFALFAAAFTPFGPFEGPGLSYKWAVCSSVSVVEAYQTLHCIVILNWVRESLLLHDLLPTPVFVIPFLSSAQI